MAEVNSQAIIAWVALAQQLALLGINAANGIKNAVKAMNPNTTNAELDAIVQAVINDATRRKNLAEAGVRGEDPQPPAGSPAAQAAQLPKGPVGTDGVTGTSASVNAPPAAPGQHGNHSAADRPDGGLPGTQSRPKP